MNLSFVFGVAFALILSEVKSSPPDPKKSQSVSEMINSMPIPPRISHKRLDWDYIEQHIIDAPGDVLDPNYVPKRNFGIINSETEEHFKKSAIEESSTEKKKHRKKHKKNKE